jgi:hypothetical protein
MAWANSLVPTATIRDALKNGIALNIGGASPDSLYVALYGTATTPAQDTDPCTYNAAPWNTGEVTGTAWPAGGVALVSPSMALVAGYGIMFDANDVSVASTTIATGIYGCLVYDNTLSPKCALAAVYFGATGYTTSNGTFGITWDVNGLFRMQLH